jgi:geranylgeranyl pyrophosphate synthase/predicted secreted hydrolase
MIDRPSDWPAAGPLDLAVHDLPHRSSTTEWWYLNAHVETETGRRLSLFASFFRLASGRDPATRETTFAHSVTWALSDADGGRYLADSRVDAQAPKLGLERLAREEQRRDPRLRRALQEVLEKGRVPHPDRLLAKEAFVAANRLELEFDEQRFAKRDDGSYVLSLRNGPLATGCEVVFTPKVPAARHGDDGVVKGTDGADMFYAFIPRCDVAGTVTIDGRDERIRTGSGWYDHEFGRHAGAGTGGHRDIAWNWVAAQLDDGRAVTAYSLIDKATGADCGNWAVVVGADGVAVSHAGLELTALDDGAWRSTRTFHEYPVRWRVTVPAAGVDLLVSAAFPDQEFISVISPPAFWEGRCDVRGTIGGEPVAGLAYAERSGFSDIDTLDQFYASVGKEVRKSVAKLLPFDPTFEEMRDLIASKGREGYLDGVDAGQFARTLAKPIREITDRGGKSWRSYAALACCDVVGGDSRDFVQWLAMPEFLHVGSLIVDDVQDRSTVRRGGPAAHLVYGEPLAINAGTACYFLGQQLLVGPKLSSAAKLRIYDLYFGALRAGHAGQAFDIEGHDGVMEEIVRTGDGVALERRVLGVHRLKTAAPAAALARMGGVAGGGSDAQIEELGAFFEAVGLAFQIVDDVLNLRGFQGDLKSRGEDIRHGKVTLPVAKAMSRLPLEGRRALWDAVRAKTSDAELVDSVISTLESTGALDACADEASERVESAWQRLDPHLEDSLPKLMLRAFGWYVLERHY